MFLMLECDNVEMLQCVEFHYRIEALSHFNIIALQH